NVAVAVESGMYEAERIGDLNAVMVIPRPLDELEQTLPVASCWIEQRQPVNLPVDIKEQVGEAELLELPDLNKLPEKVIEEVTIVPEEVERLEMGDWE
ncbi:MAG: microcompartment protein, partial [Cyanobacteria bacterium P01_H01_bin.150]